MKRSKVISLILLIVMICLPVLSACGSGESGPSNLEEYVASDDDLKAEIQSIADTNGLDIVVSGNTMTFTYKYDEEFDDDMKAQAGPLIEQALTSYSSTFTNLAKDLEEQTSLSGVAIKVVYLDGKDSELYSAEYGSEE